MAVANASAATPPEVRPLAGAAWQLLAGFLDDARPLAKTAAVRSSQKVHAPPHDGLLTSSAPSCMHSIARVLQASSGQHVPFSRA